MTNLIGGQKGFLPITRRHVTKGAEWGHTAGTDYWLAFNSGFDILAAASTATGDELAENGWIATSLVNTAGGGSDMFGGVITPTVGALRGGRSSPIPSDMGTPQHALTDATGDLLGSPSIFGDYAGAYAAMKLAGKATMPRYLVAEFLANFTVSSASEAQTAIGFFSAAATISVQATQYATIQSNGTNFLLAGAAATMATGPAVAAGWHLWRIVLQFPGGTTANVGPSCFAYLDNAIFSTTAGVGVQDQFPLRFGFHALTTNRIGCGLVHISYEW